MKNFSILLASTAIIASVSSYLDPETMFTDFLHKLQSAEAVKNTYMFDPLMLSQ